MYEELQWGRLLDDAILRAIRALLLAGAVTLLAMAQQHFSYPLWSIFVAAFVMALPHRTFPLIVFLLAVLCLLTLFPPTAISSIANFILRLRG